MNSSSSRMKTWNITIRIATMAAVLALCTDRQTHTRTASIKVTYHTCINNFGMYMELSCDNHMIVTQVTFINMS